MSKEISQSEDLCEAVGTAPEVPVQEQHNNLYPIQVSVINKIGDGVSLIDNTMFDSSQAVKVSISINNCRYEKQQVYESVKKACQKLLEYFH